MGYCPLHVVKSSATSLRSCVTLHQDTWECYVTKATPFRSALTTNYHQTFLASCSPSKFSSEALKYGRWYRTVARLR
jgi:hypothetical protein